MNILIIAQIVFYFSMSLAVIGLGILIGIKSYEHILIARDLRALLEKAVEATGAAEERVEEFFDKLSALPFLSYFFTKTRKRTHKKGRDNG